MEHPHVALSEFPPVWVRVVSLQLGVSDVKDVAFSGHHMEARAHLPSAVWVNLVTHQRAAPVTFCLLASNPQSVRGLR